MIQVKAAYRIGKTNKVLRVLSGATCLTQVLTFEDKKDIPKGLDVISKAKAIELTGNQYLLN